MYAFINRGTVMRRGSLFLSSVYWHLVDGEMKVKETPTHTAYQLTSLSASMHRHSYDEEGSVTFRCDFIKSRFAN